MDADRPPRQAKLANGPCEIGEGYYGVARSPHPVFRAFQTIVAGTIFWRSGE